MSNENNVDNFMKEVTKFITNYTPNEAEEGLCKLLAITLMFQTEDKTIGEQIKYVDRLSEYLKTCVIND